MDTKPDDDEKLADEVDVRSLLAAAKVRLAEADLRKQRLQHELSQLQKRRRARTWSSSPLPLLNQPQNQRESPPQQQRERSVAMHSLESSAWSAPPSTPVTAASAAPPTTSRRARLRERHERYLERRRSRIAARQATRLAARAAARAKHGRSPRAPPRPASSTTTVPSTWAAVNMVVGGDDDVTSNLLLVAAREQQRALHLAAVRERRAIAALRRAAVPAPSAARAAIAPRRALRRAALFLDVRSIVAAGAACARWHVALSPVEAETGGSDDGRRCSVLWRQLARRGITAEERGAFWRLALFGQLGASESRGAAARPCHGSRTIFARSGVFNRLESCAAPLFELTATLAKLSHNTHEQNAAQISDRKVRLVAAELELLQRAATLEARVQQVYVTALRATSSGEGASTSSSPRDACRRFSLTHDTAANSSTADDDESRELAGARGGGSGNDNNDDDDDALAVAEVQRWIAPLSLIEVDLRRTYGCGKAWVGVALEQGESAATLADTWWEFGAGADPMLLVSSAAKYVSEVKAEAGTEEEAGDVVASARERQLRNVLCALILYFRRGDALAAMGYCQGMNFVAAMLLRHMGSADAFWAMVLMLRSERCVRVVRSEIEVAPRISPSRRRRVSYFVLHFSLTNVVYAPTPFGSFCFFQLRPPGYLLERTEARDAELLYPRRAHRAAPPAASQSLHLQRDLRPHVRIRLVYDALLFPQHPAINERRTRLGPLHHARLVRGLSNRARAAAPGRTGRRFGWSRQRQH